MPWGPDKAPDWVKAHGDAAAEMWAKIATSALEEYGDDGRAIATANAKVKEKYGKADKSDAAEMNLFIPITKIDEEKRLVYGVVTEESLDKSGEVFDYATSKPFYEAWSGDISKATDGKSVGNLRVMHTDKVAGKLTQLVFDDENKRIECAAKVIDDAEWRMCLEGAYTGFSQGGRYRKRWTDVDDVTRYTVEPVEVSLVDNPCLSTARFSLVKADGTVEAHEFKNQKDEKVKGEVKGEAKDQNAVPEITKAESSKAEFDRRVAALRLFNKYAETEITWTS